MTDCEARMRAASDVARGPFLFVDPLQGGWGSNLADRSAGSGVEVEVREYAGASALGLEEEILRACSRGAAGRGGGLLSLSGVSVRSVVEGDITASRDPRKRQESR